MSYEWRPKAFVQCLAGAVLIRSHPRARQLASALPRLSICTTGVAIAPGIYHCTNGHSRTCAGPASFEARDAVGFRRPPIKNLSLMMPLVAVRVVGRRSVLDTPPSRGMTGRRHSPVIVREGPSLSSSAKADDPVITG